MTCGVAIGEDRVFLRHGPSVPSAAAMDVLILNRAEVEALLDLGALLDALRDGFVALTAGEVTAPGRNELTMPDEAFLLGMPGRLRDGAMTVKVVTVFESHDPSHLATIGLYDPHTGACRAFMDGTYITAIRTSAAAAVATDLLAREDATTLAIIGAGVQGEHHLRTFPLVRDFDEIRISSLYARGRAAARRAAPARARGRRSRGRGPRRGRGGAGHARRAARDRAGVDRAGHARQLGRLPPAGRRAPRALLDAAACSSRPSEAFEPTPVGCAELQGVDPATATELGEVLLGRKPGRTSARRDHRLQGDGPRRRGHRGGRARLRRGARDPCREADRAVGSAGAQGTRHLPARGLPDPRLGRGHTTASPRWAHRTTGCPRRSGSAATGSRSTSRR